MPALAALHVQPHHQPLADVHPVASAHRCHVRSPKLNRCYCRELLPGGKQNGQHEPRAHKAHPTMRTTRRAASKASGTGGVVSAPAAKEEASIQQKTAQQEPMEEEVAKQDAVEQVRRQREAAAGQGVGAVHQQRPSWLLRMRATTVGLPFAGCWARRALQQRLRLRGSRRRHPRGA